jgi:putative chitinase
MKIALTVEIMRKLWPHGNQHVPGLIEGIAASSKRVFAKYGFDSPLVVAHFGAQASEECGAGLEMIENMNYTAERLREVFPTHFSASMATNYAHNPRMIADLAYGGRMGNARPPSDDGWKYRGAGLSQVTGREGVEKLQTFLDEHEAGFNIIDSPELIIDPDHTLECGVADFVVCGCLPFAQRDDIVGVTKHLNGGLNGLADRRAWLPRWKHAL